MNFDKCIYPINLNPHQDRGHFHHPKMFPNSPSQSIPQAFPEAIAVWISSTTKDLGLCINGIIWLLCCELTSFVPLNIFESQPFSCNFFLFIVEWFHLWVYNACLSILLLVAFGVVSRFGVIMTKAAMNILLKLFLWTYVFISLVK